MKQSAVYKSVNILKIRNILNKNTDGRKELDKTIESMYQLGQKYGNFYNIKETKNIYNHLRARQSQINRTESIYKKILAIKNFETNSSLISIPNAGKNSSELIPNVDLNAVKSNKGSEEGRSRKTSKIQSPHQGSFDSDFEVPNPSSNPFTQQTDVNIPPVINLGGTTEQIQNNLAEGEGLNSLQSYKQFVKHKLLINNKLQTTSLYEAFAFQIFELLYASEKGRQIIIKIKDALYRRQFDLYLIESEWDLIRVHGGDDISDRQIKRLILDYMIKIFEGQSSVQLIQVYYVLTPILVLSVRQYVRVNIGTQKGAAFERAFEQKNIDVVYDFFAKTFGLTLTTKGNTYTFQFQSNKLIIESKNDKYLSWIQ